MRGNRCACLESKHGALAEAGMGRLRSGVAVRAAAFRVLGLGRAWSLFAVLLLSAWPAMSWAEEPSALLSFRATGNVGEAVQQRFVQALERALGTSSGLEASRAKLAAEAPAALGCFTAGCLLSAAERLACTVGYVVELREEFETYTISFKVFALSDGSLMKETSHVCELCTIDEAEQEVENAAREARAGWSLPARAPVQFVSAPDAKARLWVQAEPNDASIIVDGKAMGVGTFNGELNVGRRSIRIERASYRSVEYAIDVGDGSSRLLVALQPDGFDSQSGLLDRVDRDAWGWSATVLGVLLTGAGVTLLALDGEPTCSGDARLCPNVLDTDAGGATLLAFGVASLCAGITLLSWEVLAGGNEVELAARPDGLALRATW